MNLLIQTNIFRNFTKKKVRKLNSKSDVEGRKQQGTFFVTATNNIDITNNDYHYILEINSVMTKPHFN